MSFDDDVAAARAKAEPTLVASNKPPCMAADEFRARKLSGPPLELADGSWIGARTGCLVVFQDESEREIPFPAGWSKVRDQPSRSPSGTRVLITLEQKNRGHVLERSVEGESAWDLIASGFEEGVASHLYGTRENIWGASYAHSDDHVVLAAHGTKDVLSLAYRFPDRGWREIATVADKTLSPVCMGRLVIAPGDKKTTVYGIVGDNEHARFAKLGTIEVANDYVVHPVDEAPKLWARNFKDPESGWLLAGAEEALAKKKAKKPKKGTSMAYRFLPGNTPQAPPSPFGPEVSQYSLHPTRPRAIVQQSGWHFFDRTAGEPGQPLSDAYRAFYLPVGERVLIAVERRKESLDLYEDGLSLGTPIASIPLPDDCTAYPSHPGTFLLMRPKKRKGARVTEWAVEVWRVAETGSAELALTVEFPGTHYKQAMMFGRILAAPTLVDMKKNHFEIPLA
ncbi:MAG: hypothetical protein AAGE52_08220 [Myxococcota bacterium]